MNTRRNQPAKKNLPVKKTNQPEKEECVSIDDYLKSVHMVVDKKTEMYIKFAKVIVFAQGAYTKQREDFVKKAKDKFKTAGLVITDDNFVKEDGLLCAPERTEHYYEYFKNTATKALEQGHNLLVLDPTMSNMEQNWCYLALAHKMQYVFLVMPPFVTNNQVGFLWPAKSQAASFKSTESTQNRIIRPASMFQHLFCGWFLNDVDSYDMRQEAALYVRDGFEALPEMRAFFSSKIRMEPDSDVDVLIDAFKEHYNFPDKRQDLAYSVVKVFSDTFLSPNRYFKKPSVYQTYGKMSKLMIAGFIISPSMVAARVKLTHQQRDLWEMEDVIKEDRKDLEPYVSDLINQTKEKLPEIKVRMLSSKCNPTIVKVGDVKDDPCLNIQPQSKGAACHFLLGKSPNAESRNIDFDVQFALMREREAENHKDFVVCQDTGHSLVKRIGRFWYIYLKEMLKVDAFFSSYCQPYEYGNEIGF